MKTAGPRSRRRLAALALLLFPLTGLPLFGETGNEAAAPAGPATKTASMAEPALLPYHAISAMLEGLALPGSPRSLRVVIEVGVFAPQAGHGGGDSLYESEKRRALDILGSELGTDSGLSISGVEHKDFPMRTDLALGAAATNLATAVGSGTSRGATVNASSSDVQSLLAADDKAILKANQVEWLLLVIRIVDYRSGRYDLLETTARLLDRQTGRELARDVGWTSMVDGVTRADFIDGSRVK